MRFKTNPLQSHLIIPWLLNVGLAIFFLVQTAIMHASLAGVSSLLLLGYILLEGKRAAYIFEEEGLVWKNAFGRREFIKYESIKRAHKAPALFGKKTGWSRLALDIGRNIPYGINVKDAKGFLEELQKHVDDLQIATREL